VKKRTSLLYRYLTVIIFIISSSVLNAQVITREDSLNAGLTPKNNPTVISGYGQAKVQYDLRFKTGVASLTRNVLFIGHRFSNRISFSLSWSWKMRKWLAEKLRARFPWNSSS
jgi:hypothetical protein